LAPKYSVFAVLVLAGACQLAAAAKVPVPRPRPDLSSPASADALTDLSHAMPVKALEKLPSTEDQFRALKSEIAKDKPAVATAESTSEALAQQTQTLAQKLVATAARVEALESEKARLDSEIARLSAEEQELSQGFARDRVAASRLLAVLERVELDLPPVMALKPGDALSTARGAMLVGATLPRVYDEAAALARRLEELRDTSKALVARRAEAAANAATLAAARIELDQLLAMKRLEADAAAERYGDLKQKLDAAAAKAADLAALLQKVAALRAAPATSPAVVMVSARNSESNAKLGREVLLRPVVGQLFQGGMDGVGGSSAPGVTYLTAPAAQVVSPADGTVLFAGPYHKSGQVLILEMSGGYDAVLAGLDHLDVRPEDQLLAGEPVGTMSNTNLRPRLYFELRRDGKGLNPAPYIVVRKAKRS
jgi:septal ring factor EnvC (AmiA/AmiB activator)